MSELLDTLREYEAHDRDWLQSHPYRRGTCQRRGHCTNDWPASVFAWCPPCRIDALDEERRRAADHSTVVRQVIKHAPRAYRERAEAMR